MFCFPSLKCSLGNHNLIYIIRISPSSNSPSWLCPCSQSQISSAGCAEEAGTPLQWNHMRSFHYVVSSETSQPLSSMLMKFSVVGCVTVYQTPPQRKVFALPSSIQSLLDSRGQLHPLAGQRFWPLLEMTCEAQSNTDWLGAENPCAVPQEYISVAHSILISPRKQSHLALVRALQVSNQGCSDRSVACSKS